MQIPSALQENKTLWSSLSLFWLEAFREQLSRPAVHVHIKCIHWQNVFDHNVTIFVMFYHHDSTMNSKCKILIP